MKHLIQSSLIFALALFVISNSDGPAQDTATIEEAITRTPTAKERTTTAPFLPGKTCCGASAKTVDKYIETFYPEAKRNQERYGIPVSIKLAQALKESAAGESKMAKHSKNHFGITCRAIEFFYADQCKQYTDAGKKTLFAEFPNAWKSYEAHSELLTSKARYQVATDCPPTDYKCWARGLKKAYYAEDPHYDKGLIALIERLQLWKYDQ